MNFATTERSARTRRPAPPAPIRALALAVALAVAGCASDPAPTTAPATGAEITAGTALDCPPIEGVEPLLDPGRVVMLGEMHGTAESPAFVGDLVCQALDAGRTVTVALEIPLQESERIEPFLDSAGGEADTTALLASDYWQGAYQDGRRSRAKLALLERLRSLRHRGLPVDAVLLDDLTATDGSTRDRRLGERLLEAAEKNPGGVVVSLTGNLHNRTVRGLPWDPEHEPMGYLVAEELASERIAALNVLSAGGTGWFCTGSTPETCGAQEIGGGGEPDAGPAVELYPEADDLGYHGVYEVGRLTASPPAVEGATPTPK